MLQDGGGPWLETRFEGVARSSIASRELLISFIATGSIWSLLGTDSARGQDFVPSPPDFERAKDDGKPVFEAKPPDTDAADDVPDQSGVPGRLNHGPRCDEATAV